MTHIEDKISNELTHTVLGGFQAKEFTDCDKAEEWLENALDIARQNLIKIFKGEDDEY